MCILTTCYWLRGWYKLFNYWSQTHLISSRSRKSSVEMTYILWQHSPVYRWLRLPILSGESFTTNIGSTENHGCYPVLLRLFDWNIARIPLSCFAFQMILPSRFDVYSKCLYWWCFVDLFPQGPPSCLIISLFSLCQFTMLMYKSPLDHHG